MLESIIQAASEAFPGLELAITMDGRNIITECGTHEELLSKDGIYASLYKTQNALALEGR